MEIDHLAGRSPIVSQLIRSTFFYCLLISFCASGCARVASTEVNSDRSAPEAQETNLVCVGAQPPIYIEAGQFVMGRDAIYSEEGPPLRVELAGFWLDATEVTVGQFAGFVEATGYVTFAERSVDPDLLSGIDVSTDPDAADLLLPGGAVFNPQPGLSPRNMNWWHYVPGAYWRYPQGTDKPAALLAEPVTQISIEDARAYADWAGGRLPTEAEWEYAAVEGGTNAQTSQPSEANTWQGIFPLANSEDDGYYGVAPVGCYSSNRFGLYDLIGNVWEWTADRYIPLHMADKDVQGTSELLNVAGVETYVIKGGSFLCAPNFCYRFRAAARQPQENGLGTNHIGFRVAYDTLPGSRGSERLKAARP